MATHKACNQYPPSGEQRTAASLMAELTDPSNRLFDSSSSALTLKQEYDIFKCRNHTIEHEHRGDE